MNRPDSNKSKGLLGEELMNELTCLEDEISKKDFISAYNRLKKVQKKMTNLPRTQQHAEIKNKYQALSNELNLNILRYMSENR